MDWEERTLLKDIADNVRGIRWKVPNGVGDFCQCILLMLILFRLMQM